MKYLLDSNVVLYYLGGRLEEPLPEGDLHLSIVSEMELLSYPKLSRDEEQHIRKFIAGLQIEGISDQVKEEAINLRRMYSLKLPDANIGTNAIALGAMLLSNDAAFDKVKELIVQTVNLTR